MTDTTAPRQAVGAPGLPQYAGYVDAEWDRRLKGRRGPEAYREMSEGSPTIGALLYAFNALISQAGHRLEPADESPAAEEAATFVGDCLSDLEGAWADTLSEILTALPFGFSLLEVVYKQRAGPTNDPATSSAFADGKLGWARWAPRAQETIVRWGFDESGRATIAYQQAPPTWTEVAIPLDRCLHFKVRSRKGNPQGLSLIRNAYEPWYYWKHIGRIEAIGIERDLAGIPVVRIPQDVIDNDATALASWDQMVVNLRRDEQAGIRMPSDRDESGNYQYDVSLLTTGGTRQIDTDAVLARYERLMLRSVMADFLAQGDIGRGSYSQVVGRIDLFLSSAQAILDSFSDVIDLEIRKLLAVNGVPLEAAPHFAFNDLARKDWSTFGQTLVSLIGAGVVDPADPDLRQWVYDELGLPAPGETDEQQQAETGQETPPEDAQDQAAGTPEPGTPPPTPNPTAPTAPRKAVEPDDVAAALALFERSVPEQFKGLLDAHPEGR